MAMAQLSAMDIRKLVDEPSDEIRGVLAGKIAQNYRLGQFTPAESTIAADIFRLLIKDAGARIRKTLSEQLAHCPQAPRDIILKLASDEADVAMPVLEYSPVLTEDDLIAIVASTREVVKLCAVARRDSISENLSGALLESGEGDVLATLFTNKNAALSENGLMRSWDHIAGRPNLLEVLVRRGGLPLTVAEKIYHAVSEELKSHMARHYKFNTPFMHKAVSDVKEWEMLGLAPAQTGAQPHDDERVEDLIDDLHLSGRLTHSLLMRALCVGNLSVFEAGIARLASVPRVNARILLMEKSGLGLQAIYNAAQMPEGFFEAVRVLLTISLEETEFGRHRRLDFRKRVIDRIYMEGHHRTVENMEYLLSIIGGKILAPASVH